jgi:hypothetical protein
VQQVKSSVSRDKAQTRMNNMNTAAAIKIIERSNMDIDLMQENIDEGYEVESSMEIVDLLVKQNKEIKAGLAAVGIIVI